MKIPASSAGISIKGPADDFQHRIRVIIPTQQGGQHQGKQDICKFLRGKLPVKSIRANSAVRRFKTEVNSARICCQVCCILRFPSALSSRIKPREWRVKKAGILPAAVFHPLIHPHDTRLGILKHRSVFRAVKNLPPYAFNRIPYQRRFGIRK